jgi:hypothetical protein
MSKYVERMSAETQDQKGGLMKASVFQKCNRYCKTSKQAFSVDKTA